MVAYIRRWVHHDFKGMDVVSMGWKCPLHHQQQPELLRQKSDFMLFMENS